MTMDTTQKLNSSKMENMPVFKLIINMSLPAVLSMLVLALYNVVDSIFVAKYSPKALDALSIVFPMQQLIIAFAVGIAVGTNAYVSRKLGQKKLNEAVLTAQTGLFMAIIGGILFLILGLTVARPFVSAFTDDPETINFGVTYLTVVMGLCLGSFIEIVGNRVLQATGNMKIPMLSQLLGAIVNIILDPIFIFTFDMGVLGAALATVIGQFCAMGLVLASFRFGKQDVTIFFNKSFRLKAPIVKGIIKIGLPVMIMNSVAAFVTTILNIILKAFQSAITVLGVYFKLQSFVFMPVFGLTQGVLPILSYNYGAKNKARFMSTYRYSLLIALSIMALGTIIFQFFPSALMTLFNADSSLLTTGVTALRIISITFIFAAFGILSTTMIQALRMGSLSLWVSLLRQLILIIPLAILLSKYIGVIGVWLAFPISEISVSLCFLFLLKPIFKKKFVNFPQPAPQKTIEGETQNV